jgi:serine/threonine protein kinase
MPNRVGTTIGKYKLLELLGRGGMAEVYKARHPTLGRDVTVKILHPHLAEGEGFLARFEREAKAVAAMRHPNIVQIFDYEAAEDAKYMVMEFVDAGTLQDRFSALAREGKRMPIREALPLLRQVAAALDYAHERGILHRDVKPSNILLDTSGNAYLTDFGIARILSTAQFTATGVMIGTPAYMSPEQGAGEELSAASDIYSLGVIAYELLAGRVPFTSETTPLAVIHKHIHEPPPKLHTLREEIPAAVEDVVEKALSKNPKGRFRNAGEFIRALEKALPEETVRRLDSGSAGDAIPRSAQPTVVMEEPAAPIRSRLPTEVMESAAAETAPEPVPDAQETPEPVRREETVESAPAPAGGPLPSPPWKAETPQRKAAVPAAGIAERFQPVMVALRGFLGTRRGRITVVVLAVAAVLAVGWWLLSGGFAALTCGSVESCIDQANATRDQGDLAGYVDLMRAAAGKVPGDQHPPNAGIWCDIGDAERELGRMDDARGSFTQCIEWTEGDPGIQGLRDAAEDALRGL